MAKVQIPCVTLNNGVKMPYVGYGTWMGINDQVVISHSIEAEAEFLMTEVPKMKEALSYAIDIGYRHIDTAHLYRVEPEVGEVVAEKIKEGVVKREELFITTKVWQHMHREKDVERSVRDSLKRLKMDYVDQVLIHWPMSVSQEGEDEKIDYLETWRGFEKVLELGLTKSIGVSNFNIEQLKRLIANSKIVPATNQVEINLTLGQKELVDYCKSQNIVVVAYSPFGAMVPSRSYDGTPGPKLDDPIMVGIAKKYDKTVSQIALKYLNQRGIVVIPKTITKSRVLENASIFDFQLDASDVAAIAKFDVNFRLVRPTFWENIENYPFDKVLNGAEPGKIPLALRKW